MERPAPMRSVAFVSDPGVVDIPTVDPEEPAPRLLADLHTRRDGLAASEASRRLQQFGPNEIPRAGPGVAGGIVRQ